MKRFISALLILLLLNLTVFSVSAESAESVEMAVFTEASMTEEEFRNYSPAISMFSFYSPNQYHKNGYYYSLIQRKNVLGLAQKTYDSIINDLSNEPLSGTWSISIQTDLFKGMDLNDFADLKDTIFGEVLSGAWCFKYDNPSKCDRFTNEVESEMSYSYYPHNNTVATVAITVKLYVHPYFNSSLLIERDNKIDEIVAVANRKPSQYLALKYIHDTLNEMAEYDYDNVNASSSTESFLFDHSALGILAGIHKLISGKDTVQRKAVCEGYAKAFMEICKKLDDAPYVGLLTSKTHMWNIVLLDGKWYCVDLTWDDGKYGDIYDTYFLCGDPDIVDGSSTDHVPDGEYTEPPEYAESKYVFNPSKGDITFDGEINILDIIRFKKIYSGSLDKEFYTNADLDGNNVFNASDLAKLKIQVMKTK